MKVQINTDKNIDATPVLTEQVQQIVTAALERFRERLTRQEVHLSDENSHQKKYGEAMRCRLEARPASHDPVFVSADAEKLILAVSEASRKMERLLETLFSKLDDRRH
jgi:ribosome-associated translation inhibitor RaiA